VTGTSPAMTGRVYFTKCSDAPRPDASALTRIAVPGTPSAFSASTICWALDRPRFSAADCAEGSLEVESPYPVTEIVAVPRLAAKAFTSSVAGCDKFDAPSRNTMVADSPAGGAGIGSGTA
jgi:hypothetical protein